MNKIKNATSKELLQYTCMYLHIFVEKKEEEFTGNKNR